MKNFNFWQKWLLAASVLIILSGILITFSGFTGVFDLFAQMIAPAFGENFPDSSYVADFQKFVYAVIGSTMAGWGVFVAFVTHFPFQKREKWAWTCLFLGSLLWFVLDTSFSVYYQVYANAALNTSFFILLQLPLVFTRMDFFK